MSKIDDALAEVRQEVTAVSLLHPPMHSAHEGYAVLLEEVDELWEEVKKSPRKRDIAAMHAEAVQVAAMAIRFMTDVTLPMLKGEE